MSDTDDTDWSDEPKRVSDSAVQRVHTLALEFTKAKQKIEQTERALKAANEEFGRIRDVTLPDAIKEMGVKGTDIPGIGYVSWKPEVYGSLPSRDKRPEDRAKALAWLLENDPGLVKRELVATMPRDMPLSIDRGQAKQVMDLLNQVTDVDQDTRAAAAFTLNDVVERIIEILVPGTTVTTDLDVHAQTLMAWGREAVRSGKKYPFKDLGLVPVDRATIKK